MVITFLIKWSTYIYPTRETAGQYVAPDDALAIHIDGAYAVVVLAEKVMS